MKATNTKLRDLTGMPNGNYYRLKKKFPKIISYALEGLKVELEKQKKEKNEN